MEPPKDLDIAMPNLKDAEAFIRIISCSYAVVDTKKRSIYTCADTKLSGMTLRISPYPCQAHFDTFTMDVAISPMSHSCLTDFTCNLLSFSRNGLNLTYVPDVYRFEPSPIHAVSGCIKSRTFSIVGVPEVLLRKEAILAAERLCRRAASMVQRGWTMTPDARNSFLVARHMDYVRGTANPPCKPPSEVKHNSCGVCLDGYKEDDVVVLCRCSHVFHASCIGTWLAQGRSVCSCPACRDTDFMLKTAADRCVSQGGTGRRDVQTETGGREEGEDDDEDDEDVDGEEEDEDDDEDYEEEDEEEEEEDDIEDDIQEGRATRGRGNSFSVTFAI